MSCWNKVELEQMLEDVVNELELSEDVQIKYGSSDIPTAQLVRLVLDEKDRTINLLRQGCVDALWLTRKADTGT